jgi:hypothetical protein
MPKISQLEAATDITASDLMQVVDIEDTGMAPSGTNKKITAQLLADDLAGIVSAGSIATSKLASGALPSGVTVSSTNIVNGTIVDADINASAAIAPSKLGTGALPSGVTVSSTNLVDGTIAGSKIEDSTISLAKITGLGIMATSNDFILQSDYGIVSGNSSDSVATANASYLATALTESASLNRPLLLSGTIYVKGEVLVTGSGIRAIGPATIIQKDTSHNGLTLNPVTVAAYNVIFTDINITGQGAANHNAAAFYAKKDDLSYLTSDIKLVDCNFSGFRYGCDLAGIAKFRTENLTISGCRVGHRWNHMQTCLMTNSRVVQGDSDANSACFEITGGNQFAGKILMGEFGGAGIARFATITSGLFHVEAANLESFSSPQTISKSGTGSVAITLKNSRIANSYSSATSAIISCEVNGNAGVPVLDVSNIYGWSGSPRIIEIWGTHSTGGGAIIVDGDAQPVTFSDTQGGTENRTIAVHPSARDYSLTSSFPVSLAIPGFEISYSSPSGVDSDSWARGQNLRRYRNNHTSENKWSSQLNDALMRVLSVSGRTASGNNVETDIQNFTLPIGTLRNNGEMVEIDIFGSTAANTNDKQFRFYFGGSSYFNFGLLPINGESWTLKIRIQRGSFSGGTGYMKLVGVLDYGSGKVIKTAETPNATIDSIATISTRTTVLTPSAASDVVSLAARTTWFRAPSSL